MLFGPFTVGAIIGCGAEPSDGKTDGEIVEASAEVQMKYNRDGEELAPSGTDAEITLSPETVSPNDGCC